MFTGNPYGQYAFLLTVEHAVAHVPAKYQSAFAEDPKVLTTHRAFDKNAKFTADLMKAGLKCPIHYGNVSRLLVDLNRSANHSAIYSDFIKNLRSQSIQAELFNRYYVPFRKQTYEEIQNILMNKGKKVIHFSVHSFDASLSPERVHCDIGLLYDPARKKEKNFCIAMKKALQAEFRIRMNFPYRGVSDGHTSHLRRLFSENQYIGIEIELNQSLTFDRLRLFSEMLLQWLKE